MMREKFSRRRLPHWDLPGATYFITTCLLGSIPAQGLLEIERFRLSLQRQPKPAGISADEWQAKQWKQVFARHDDWLDRQPAVRHLEDERLAEQVEKSLKHFASERYDLIAWVVMPSHYHWVFRPRDEWVRSLGPSVDEQSPRGRIQHAVNLNSAIECNKLLGQTGGFWQRESHDHCVRDEEELEHIVAYVHGNPVASRLVERAEDYPLSSAREFAQRDGHTQRRGPGTLETCPTFRGARFHRATSSLHNPSSFSNLIALLWGRNMGHPRT